MSNSAKGIYDNLPNEYNNENQGRNTDPKLYINKLLKTAIPSMDLQNTYQKALFALPKTSKKRSNKIQKKKVYISRKEKQNLNLLKVPKTGWDYEQFDEMRQMWQEYIISYLDLNNEKIPNIENKNWSNFHVLLGKADYHGAEMTVTRSKCPSMVGITGTCILDTKNTFKILSKDNKARTVPKKDSVFRLQIKNLEITIFGKYFTMRPADRSAKKIKTQMMLDL